MAQVEPHPFPEPALWRLGGPVVAAALTGVILGAVLLLAPGTSRTTTIAVGLVLHGLLMLGRGWYLRRTARELDHLALAHQFLFAWGWWGGGTVLLGGSGVAVIDIGVGVGFAAVLTGMNWYAMRPPRAQQRTSLK